MSNKTCVFMERTNFVPVQRTKYFRICTVNIFFVKMCIILHDIYSINNNIYKKK